MTGPIRGIWVIAFVAGTVAGAAWVLRRAISSDDESPSLDELCSAIVGKDKSVITAVFGPPHASAGFASLAPATLLASDSTFAETWYYPLDHARRAALVVEFANGVAADAHLVQSPIASTSRV